MQTSADGRALIEAFEGCEKKIDAGNCTTYYDSVGVLTIGYGHTNLGNVLPHIKAGDIWTQEQCDTALSSDLAKAEATVTKVITINLQQYEFDALVSFEFNTGDLARSSIAPNINVSNKSQAMNILLEYCHAAGQVLPGLVRRRQAERLMFLGDVQAALTLAGAHVDTGLPMAKGAAGETA